MTRTEAADVLRTIPAGTGSARERALAVALEALLAAPSAKPKPRAAAKPKQSRHVAWMLKQRFPGEPDAATQRAAYRSLMGRDVPELTGLAAAQFAYGSRSGPNRHSKEQDAAILHAAAA